MKFFAFTFAALVSMSFAVAQDVSADESGMRGLSAAETAAVNSLTPFSPPSTDRAWGVVLIKGNEPINIAGLPRDRAFERTTLAFFPPKNDLPTGVTIVKMWPEVDGHNMERLGGTLFRCLNGTDVWLFDFESSLNEFRNDGVQCFVELEGAKNRFLRFWPGVFSGSGAWQHVDQRFGSNERFTVLPRPKDETGKAGAGIALVRPDTK